MSTVWFSPTPIVSHFKLMMLVNICLGQEGWEEKRREEKRREEKRREEKRREEKRREEKRREEKRREEKKGFGKHTVSWACTRGAVFLLGVLAWLLHPRKDMFRKSWVWGQRGRLGWWFGRGPATGPATSAAAWLLGGIWGSNVYSVLRRGNLGGWVVFRWQTGPHAAAIKLFRLGMLGLWGCAGAERL